MIVELFAGPGGMSEGARMIGRDDLVGIEIEPHACATRGRELWTSPPSRPHLGTTRAAGSSEPARAP